MKKTETKFKVYLPGHGGKAGMQPLTHDSGRWAGKIRLFKTKGEAESIAASRGPKALAIPVSV